MPEFRYLAMDRQGQSQEGTLTADSAAYVYQALRERNLLPIQVKAAASPFAAAFRLQGLSRPDAGTLALFCRQLAMVLQTGMSLLRGLEILGQQLSDRRMRQKVGVMSRQVQTGSSLSEAMASADSRMPSLLVRMVATGEASGNLDQILRRMANFYEQEHTARQKIKGAMVYPAILAVVAVGVLVFVFQFLIPKIEDLLAGTGAELPALTRGVLSLAAFFQENSLWILLFLVGVLIFLGRYLATPRGRLQRDWLLSRLPVVGPLSRYIVTARFAHTAEIVFRSGIPLLQGLELIRQNLGNAVAEQVLGDVAEGVRRGEGMAVHLESRPFFDSMMIQMVRLGEETGRMDEIMEQMAVNYDREVQTRITQLLALIEPVMILIVGGIVAVVVLAVMLPLFEMIGKIR